MIFKIIVSEKEKYYINSSQISVFMEYYDKVYIYTATDKYIFDLEKPGVSTILKYFQKMAETTEAWYKPEMESKKE